MLHSLNVGGAEVLAARLAHQLDDAYRFVFACLDDVGPLAEELKDRGCRVINLARKPGIDRACTSRLRSLIREENVDLLHAHQYTPFSYAILARGLKRRPPVLFTEHGRWFPDVRRRKRVWFNWLALRKGDRVVGVGEHVRRALVENEGIAARRIGVIYNGVDVDAYSTRSNDRADVRRELGISDDAVVCIQVARLDALKDYATGLRAIERVIRQRDDVRYVIVGEGPEQELLEREIARRGFERHVHLAGLRSDVPRLLATADVFLLTSVSEGIPLTILEAMAAGLPIVATRVGGVPEIVEDGISGLLAEPGSDEALASHVLRLAGDPGLRDAMGSAGRRRVESRFSERQNHEAYRRLYAEMLGD